MQIGTRIHESPTIASRYLAGQLAPSELQAYERYLFDNPAAVRELEATALMKVGLANLRDTGQLATLLRAPPAMRSRWLALGAAAALAVIAVGLWRDVEAPRDTTLAATASELLDRSGRQLTAGSSYALLRTRSSAYDAVIELPPEPRAIEFRVRPEAVAPIYSVALSQIRPDGSVLRIGNVSELSAQPDDFVRLYVDSSRLEAGPHLLVITPAQDRAATAASAFRVKVTQPCRSQVVDAPRVSCDGR